MSSWNRNQNDPSGRLQEARRWLTCPRRPRVVPVAFQVSLSWPVKVTIGGSKLPVRSRSNDVFCRTTEPFVYLDARRER